MSKHTRVTDKIQDNSRLESILRCWLGCGKDEPWANLTKVEWIAFFGVLLFALVMPFLFSRITTENFLTPKEFFTKMLIPCLAALLFSGKLINCFFYNEKSVKLAKTSLDLPLFVFFAFLTLSLLFSGTAIKSGVRDLREVFSVMLLFPIIINVFKARWQVDALLWTFVLTGLLTSFIGILETYNWYFKITESSISFARDEIFAGHIDPEAFYIPLFPQLASKDYAMTSVVSTFGNRNYLGTFAMFTAFIPLGFYFYYTNKIAKAFSFITFATILSGLYVSRCRAALLGIVIGAVFMVFIMLLNDRGRKLFRKNFLIFSASILLIVVVLLGISVKSLRNVESENIYDKLKKTLILDRMISNVYERVWVWYANNRTFFENPKNILVGAGFGTFKHFFPYKESEYLSNRNRETFTPVTFRQAHNDWLQILSELGIVGLVLFIFLLSRFFGSIQNALRKSIYAVEQGELKGDQVLLIALLAAMVSQLLAAIPDFPFHRIETAAYAVIILAIIPVLTETDFFKREIDKSSFLLTEGAGYALILTMFVAAVSNLVYEYRCWKADTNARSAEMLMKQERYPDAFNTARALLEMPGYGINLDDLPGDPYLKLSTIYERLAGTQKNEQNKSQFAKIALAYADKAMPNINFNARSTYHSVVFRQLHIYYHILADLHNSRKKALEGLNLTAGDARSIYNFYLGKIDLDLLLPKKELTAQDRAIADEAIVNLQKAAKFESFTTQSNVFLAMVSAKASEWKIAKEASQYVNVQTGNSDPMMLNIEGISLMNLGEYPMAEQKLKQALARSPYGRGNVDVAAIRRDLGYLYIKQGQLDKAEQEIKSVLGMSNVSPELKADCQNMLNSIGRK